jgi:hypothetical protein
MFENRDETDAMSPAATISLDEYLHTSYRPDCEYLEGELLQRNVGEWDHGRLQHLLSRYLGNREKELGILVGRRAFVYTAEGVREVKDDVLCTQGLRICVPLSELE